MEQLALGELQIEVVRKEIKNVHLSVHPPDGRVRVAAPLKLADESIRLFLLSKMAWIRRQQAQFEAQPRQTEREMIDRETHYFEGRRFLLRVIFHEGSPRVELRGKKIIELFIREKDNSRERRLAALRAFYRKELKKKTAPLLEKWQSRLGVQADEWAVKLMRTKWGSCNIAARRVWLNLELAKKPDRCLEYVIAHELAHLLERHHSDRFRAILDEAMPDWALRRAELNGMEL